MRPNKTKGWNLYFQNQSINIVYPNKIYPFLIDRHEMKLDPCPIAHREKNPKYQYHISQRELIMSYYPSWKEMRSLPQTKFVTMNPTKWRVQLFFSQNESIIVDKCLVWYIFISTFLILYTLYVKGDFKALNMLCN